MLASAIDCFVIDPPWPKKKGGKRASRPNQGRELDYQTLDLPAIFDLLDKEVLCDAALQHNVFMWAVDQFLSETELAMKARGYRLHARIIWDKENGMAPAFTVRYAHEYLLWYYKPKMIPVSIEARGKLTTVIRAKSRQHSRKPDESYQYIERLYPNCNKMDVFSREARRGWRQWGNQCTHFTDDE